MAAVTFSLRHLVILGLGATVACGGRRTGVVAPAPPTPEATIEQFLTAANAGDLEGMAMVWGDERGPSAVTNVIKRDERQRRLTIMQRLLHSDNHTITATDHSNMARPVLTVAMSQGTHRFAVPFTLVRSRGGGWLINEIDLAAAMPQAGPRQPN